MMMKQVAVSQAVVSTHAIDGREFNVERIVWTGTDGLSFDVYDTATGLCLTPESLDDEPGRTEIEELLNRLREDVTSDTVDHFFEFDLDKLCEVLSKKGE